MTQLTLSVTLLRGNQCARAEEGVEEYVEEGVDDEDEDGSAGGRLGFRPHDDGDLDEYV